MGLRGRVGSIASTVTLSLILSMGLVLLSACEASPVLGDCAFDFRPGAESGFEFELLCIAQ